ncbi:ribonuclease Z [Aureisphaera sp. CAU 1614]|uniref:Ribonuclease Z n=1 Tax=Halomarinibacterium sedimenti TaxID=2857106 RepID=A0A9X1FNU0_9FLAO|nr:ribonuclease Z [Halomarinibacterium sedimenti]MBW2937931.1 ribonuclease Z [Halomarinibacterium sedimenti]
MKISEHNNYVVLADDRGGFSDFVPFLTTQVKTNFKGKNLVIDLLKYTHITLEELLELVVLSTKHRAAKNSFVIVNNSINPDDIPDEMIVVPTLQEAADIIEMEEIERDLGF